MLKIKGIIKDGKHLKIRIKKPRGSLIKTFKSLEINFKDEDNYLPPYLDIDGKSIILTFVLRNKEDLKLYTNCKDLEIYERLNEIQYLLKIPYSKKKIRRKVKEVMKLVEKVKE